MSASRIAHALLLTMSLVGCAGSARQEQSALARFDDGQPEDAVELLVAAAESRGAERELLVTESAIGLLMAGETRQAESRLNQVRNELQYLRQMDLGEQTSAMISDDKAVAWSGREFELRMIDSLLILSSLVGDRQDAIAYASQADEYLLADREAMSADVSEESKLVTVGHSEVRPPPALVINSLAAYLIAAVRSESPMNTAAARQAIDSSRFWNQEAPEKVLSQKFGVQTSNAHGTLHVVTFTGRITDWKPESAHPTTAALLIADQILSAAGDHTLPPTIAPVRIGRPALSESRQPHRLTAITLTGDSGQYRASSEVFLDLNQVAHASYVSDRDRRIARAVARRIVKKGAVYAAKDQLAIDKDSGADILLSLGGAAWEALEKPDLRHLRLLPERIDLAVIPLAVGDYQMDLSTVSPGKPSAKEKSVSVSIRNGRNTFVLCFRPRDTVTHVLVGN